MKYNFAITKVSSINCHPYPYLFGQYWLVFNKHRGLIESQLQDMTHQISPALPFWFDTTPAWLGDVTKEITTDLLRLSNKGTNWEKLLSGLGTSPYTFSPLYVFVVALNLKLIWI